MKLLTFDPTSIRFLVLAAVVIGGLVGALLGAAWGAVRDENAAIADDAADDLALPYRSRL